MQEAQDATRRPARRIRIAWAAGASAALTALALTVGAAANAATLFSDDFNDGNAAGWSTSGGSWSVSSGAYSQSGTSASAKALAGSTSWSTATVSARVQAGAFGSATLTRDRRHRPGAELVELLRARAHPHRGADPQGRDHHARLRPVLRGHGHLVSAVAERDRQLPVRFGQRRSARVRHGRLVRHRPGRSAGQLRRRLFDDVLATDAAGPGPTTSPPTSPSDLTVTVHVAVPAAAEPTAAAHRARRLGHAGRRHHRRRGRPTVTVTSCADLRTQAQA